MDTELEEWKRLIKAHYNALHTPLTEKGDYDEVDRIDDLITSLWTSLIMRYSLAELDAEYTAVIGRIVNRNSS